MPAPMFNLVWLKIPKYTLEGDSMECLYTKQYGTSESRQWREECRYRYQNFSTTGYDIGTAGRGNWTDIDMVC